MLFARSVPPKVSKSQRHFATEYISFFVAYLCILCEEWARKRYRGLVRFRACLRCEFSLTNG